VKTMIRDLQLDLQALIGKKPNVLHFVRALLLKREFHIVLLYRLSYRLHAWGIPLLPTLLQRLNIIVFGIEISYKIRIAPGFKINHGLGTVIGDADIGSNVVIFQNVTIGTNYPELTNSRKPKGYPTIEENVVIFAGAKIVGPVTIGKNSIIGANAVVTSHVLPNSIVSVPQPVVIGTVKQQSDMRMGGSGFE
jgi:serine O-acetyltransferase